MGKPCLLIRDTTERQEGLNRNVVISNYETDKILDFVNNYKKYKIPPSNKEFSPTKIIVDYIKWKISA